MLHMSKLLNNEYILIIGGNGFLGRFLVKELCKTRANIIIAARHASDAYDFQTFGNVGQITLKNVDANNFEALEKLIAKSTIVINLVGVLFETRKQRFMKMHHTLPEKIAELCKKHNIKQFIHISANNADKDLTSEYAKSKFAGENAVQHTFPNATIIRPNVIFGEGDNFLNKFKNISTFFPMLPLVGGGNTMFQPVYVGDVAKLICAIVTDSSNQAKGDILEVVGPEQMKFKYILQSILKTLNRKRMLISLPFWFAKIKAFFFELLPNPPILTRDQVELLKNNHILPKGAKNALDTFKIKKTPLKAKLHNILNY